MEENERKIDIFIDIFSEKIDADILKWCIYTNQYDPYASFPEGRNCQPGFNTTQYF